MTGYVKEVHTAQALPVESGAEEKLQTAWLKRICALFWSYTERAAQTDSKRYDGLL